MAAVGLIVNGIIGHHMGRALQLVGVGLGKELGLYLSGQAAGDLHAQDLVGMRINATHNVAR